MRQKRLHWPQTKYALRATACEPISVLWDLLATRDDLTQVTGDKLLLQDAAMLGRVTAPEEFGAQFLH